MDTNLNQSKLAAIVRTHYSGLLNLVRGKVKDRELAADLVHQAITVLLEHAQAGRLTHLNQIGGYLYRTCQNLLRNHRRNMGNREWLRVDPELLENIASGDQADLFDDRELRRVVLKVLESLTLRDREVVRRFYLDEEEKETICADLGISSVLFNKIVSRARQHLRNELQKDGFSGRQLLSLFAVLLAFSFASANSGGTRHHVEALNHQ